MTTDEVMRLRPPKKNGDGAAEIIVEPGDMLIFVSGHFPILGMQMLYFSDPELARRSAMAPPNMVQLLIAVQEHVLVDSVEAIPEDEFASELERGFVEELRKG